MAVLATRVLVLATKVPAVELAASRARSQETLAWTSVMISPHVEEKAQDAVVDKATELSLNILSKIHVKSTFEDCKEAAEQKQV